MDDLREQYVTVEEAARLANRKESLIRALCREGRLPGATKMGNSWLIPKDSALNYHPEKRGPKPKKERLAAELATIRAELTETGTGGA